MLVRQLRRWSVLLVLYFRSGDYLLLLCTHRLLNGLVGFHKLGRHLRHLSCIWWPDELLLLAYAILFNLVHLHDRFDCRLDRLEAVHLREALWVHHLFCLS